MASIKLGKVAFSWKGVYTAATTYQLQDVVAFNGDSHVCIKDGTVGITPPAAANWALFAQGTQGVSTAAGEVIYNTGAGLAALPVGTAGQVLTVNGSGLPVWGTPTVRSGTKVLKLPENAKGAQPNSYRMFGTIMADRSIRMWGSDGNTKMGQGGNAVARSYPQRVGFAVGFPGADKLYLSYNTQSSCIDVNGKLWTWGSNAYGSLGTGNVTNQNVPYNASTNPSSSIFNKTVTQVAQMCGIEDFPSTMVLCSDGTVHSCGYNAHGQLGLGDTVQRNVFVQVPILTGITSISAGRERYTTYYAVKADGTLYGWGYNADYNIGNGNITQQNIPVVINGGDLAGKLVRKVWGCWYSGYALDSNGNLYAWGNGTTYGHTGHGAFGIQATPKLVLTNVNDIVAGNYDYPVIFAKKNDGTLWATGAGNYSARGTNNTNHTATWEQVPLRTTVNKVAKGGTGSYNYAAALLTDGTVQTWGYNGNGALAVGDVVQRNTPVDVPIAGRIVVDISAFGSTSEQSLCFQLDDGQILVSGFAGGSQLPEDDSEGSYVPMPVVF